MLAEVWWGEQGIQETCKYQVRGSTLGWGTREEGQVWGCHVVTRFQAAVFLSPFYF